MTSLEVYGITKAMRSSIFRIASGNAGSKSNRKTWVRNIPSPPFTSPVLRHIIVFWVIKDQELIS